MFNLTNVKFHFPQWQMFHYIDLICSPSRCPNSNDYYLSSIVPISPNSGLLFPTHYKRFIFKMFAFVDPNVYQPLSEQVINRSTDENPQQKHIFVFFCQHCFPCTGVHSLQYSCLCGYAGCCL